MSRKATIELLSARAVAPPRC